VILLLSASWVAKITGMSHWRLAWCLFWYWALNSGPSPWATPPALFLWTFFWDRVSWTICPTWLQTVILLISASWIARITGASHWCLALDVCFNKYNFIWK
jgi:hypothetical protein